LNSTNERQILYGLSLLESIKKEELLPYLQNLLKHPSADIKVRVLQMLQGYEDTISIPEIEALTKNKSQDIRVGSIKYLLNKSANKMDILNRFLDSEDYRVIGSALIAAARELQEDRDLKEEINFKELFDRNLKKYLTHKDDPETQLIKLNAAEIIGISNDPDLYSYLDFLLNDSSSKVIQAAIISSGKIRRKEFLPALINHLNTKGIRKYTREALSKFGEDIIDDLVAHMKNDQESLNLRFGIIKVLAMIGSQQSVNALIENLKQDDLAIRYQTLKSLNKLKVNFPILDFDEKLIDDNLMEETKNYYKIFTIFNEEGNIKTDVNADGATTKVAEARALLIRALEEKMDDNLERIFRLLGLKYLQKDMYNAYLGIKSKITDLRANAIEFLDNILDFNLKRFIIPIVESDTTDYLAEKGQELFGFEISTETECLTLLLNGNDDWLKSCALFLLAELNNKKCISQIEALKTSNHLIVSETANYALNNLSQ
jgi:AAA family ATP:ADP antiporter